MENQYSMRSPAVKRLMREAQELRQPSEEYYAQPLEDNLFEWHFTVRGPSDSDFDNGIYHGRIILPPEYPMKPPSIILLTPNGRFEINKKICLSISGYHPESWQPSWSIRTALIAIIGFMPSSGNGAIGSLDYTPAERQSLAKKSHTWKCSVCGSVTELLLKRTKNSRNNLETGDMVANIRFNQQDNFEDSNGRLLSPEPPVPSTSELPFSRPLVNTVPIPLPDHNIGDMPHFPAGVGIEDTTPHVGLNNESPTVESHSDQPSTLRQRASAITPTEPTVNNSSIMADAPRHNYFFSVFKMVIILIIAILALRRFYFV